MRGREAELRAAGARVVFVGTGLPGMAADFARTHGGSFPVLSDVKKSTYRAAGMRRSLWSTLHPRLLLNTWRALRSGFRQGRVQGDPFQQGGALVFDPDGRVVLTEIDRAGGDPLDVGAIVAAAATIMKRRA